MRVWLLSALCSLLILIAGCEQATESSVAEPGIAGMQVGAGEAWTLTMYYWDDGWVRLGAIDGGFLPADLRIGINAHNWGPDYPGLWAEFDNVTAYGDIDLPPGVIEDFDGGSIEPIWWVGNTGWWSYDGAVTRADVPEGSDNGIYHIAAMDTWATVVHGEFDVQVDFVVDEAFHVHGGSQANVMLCLWDEPYENGICATPSSGHYALWRGIDAQGPQPTGYYTLQEYTSHRTGKRRITRTRVHKGGVVESVSGSGSFTNAEGAWRTFSFSARRHADGTVDGQWERIPPGARQRHGIEEPGRRHLLHGGRQ